MQLYSAVLVKPSLPSVSPVLCSFSCLKKVLVITPKAKYQEHLMSSTKVHIALHSHVVVRPAAVFSWWNVFASASLIFIYLWGENVAIILVDWSIARKLINFDNWLVAQQTFGHVTGVLMIAAFHLEEYLGVLDYWLDKTSIKNMSLWAWGNCDKLFFTILQTKQSMNREHNWQ